MRSSRSNTTLEILKLKPLNYSIFDPTSSSKDVLVLHGQGTLNGKTAVVTYGSSGIGLETCKALAAAGCRVIMGTKSISEAEKAIASEVLTPGKGNYIVEAPDASNLIVKLLDMGDLLSIKLFAKELLANEERIDFLILNEGVIASRVKKYTSAGFEKHMGVNHFGPAYLVSLLQPKLESQHFHSRVIVVSSSAHAEGYINFKDLHYTNGRFYSPWTAYANSKLANVLFTKKLADTLKGSKATALCVHPGVVGFNFSKEIFVEGFFTSFLFTTRKTIPQGAATVVWACLDSALDGDEFRGQYFADCTLKTPAPVAQNEAVAEKLWTETYTQLAAKTKTLDIDWKIQRSLSISSHVVIHNSTFDVLSASSMADSDLKGYTYEQTYDPSRYESENTYKLMLGLDEMEEVFDKYRSSHSSKDLMALEQENPDESANCKDSENGQEETIDEVFASSIIPFESREKQNNDFELTDQANIQMSVENDVKEVESPSNDSEIVEHVEETLIIEEAAGVQVLNPSQSMFKEIFPSIIEPDNVESTLEQEVELFPDMKVAEKQSNEDNSEIIGDITSSVDVMVLELVEELQTKELSQAEFIEIIPDQIIESEMLDHTEFEQIGGGENEIGGENQIGGVLEVDQVLVSEELPIVETLLETVQSDKEADICDQYDMAQPIDAVVELAYEVIDNNQPSEKENHIFEEVNMKKDSPIDFTELTKGVENNNLSILKKESFENYAIYSM